MLCGIVLPQESSTMKPFLKSPAIISVNKNVSPLLLLYVIRVLTLLASDNVSLMHCSAASRTF